MTSQKNNKIYDRVPNFNRTSVKSIQNDLLENSIVGQYATRSSDVRRNYLEFIQTLDIFRNTSTQFRAELFQAATLKRYPKGGDIFTEGMKAYNLYIVLDGCVKLSKSNANGDETILQLLTKGNIFLASAVFMNATYPVTAKVTKNVLVLAIPASIIRNGVKTNGNFALNLLNAIAKNSHSLILHTENIKNKSCEERFGWFLLKSFIEQPSTSNFIELPYTRSSLALYLGMQPETLSRVLKRFRANGFRIASQGITIPTFNSICKFCNSDTASLCSLSGTSNCPKFG